MERMQAAGVGLEATADDNNNGDHDDKDKDKDRDNKTEAKAGGDEGLLQYNVFVSTGRKTTCVLLPRI